VRRLNGQEAVVVSGRAVAAYDPEREAVVLGGRHEAVSLYLVRADGVSTLGTLTFVTAA
jgi:hypothetical protein